MRRRIFTLAVALAYLGTGCGSAPESDQALETANSQIIAGTVLSASEAEREGLANVNFLPNLVASGSAILVNKRYLVTAAHVIQRIAYASQYEVVMGNQRSRLSRVWYDS